MPKFSYHSLVLSAGTMGETVIVSVTVSVNVNVTAADALIALTVMLRGGEGRARLTGLLAFVVADLNRPIKQF